MRLRRDARGGAAVMLAMMVVPLLLFVGSAVDVARVYTVKARLQQACDAGVLAGRRTMTDTSSSTDLDATATAQAKAFFLSNFRYNQDMSDPANPGPGAPGWMQTSPAKDPSNASKYIEVFKPGKTTDSQVKGTATIKVPMAIMKMFGFQPITLTATCEARYDTADADIMFVLDQTGSMACLPSDDNDSTCKTYVGYNSVPNGNSWTITEKDGSRIQALRDEVLTFFDKVTDANNVDPSTNFRFGFVPYNAVANVGKLLQPLGYMKPSADYQTRYVDYANPDVNSGNPGPTTLNKTQTQCNAIASPVRNPATARTYDVYGAAHWFTTTWTNGKCQQLDQIVVPNWRYNVVKNVDTSQFITGAAVDNPALADGSTSTWTGCVEERNDTSSDNQTSFSMTSPPKDLDPDSAPTQTSEKWSPWWGEVTFARLYDGELTADTGRTTSGRPYKNGNNWVWGEGRARVYNEAACPLAAKRLTETTLAGNTDVNARAAAKATVKAAIKTYLSAANGFKPYGTTYHDVGMKWGLRLISPTGMFKNDTLPWTGHNAPNRFIIFLTDGDIETDPANEGGVYSEYGMERYDGRVANGATASTNPSLDSYHNARFLASCQMAKNRNIKVFVIAFAQALTTELTNCASPGQAYTAANQTGLNTAFAAIAKQVAMLRLSK